MSNCGTTRSKGWPGSRGPPGIRTSQAQTNAWSQQRVFLTIWLDGKSWSWEPHRYYLSALQTKLFHGIRWLKRTLLMGLYAQPSQSFSKSPDCFKGKQLNSSKATCRNVSLLHYLRVLTCIIKMLIYFTLAYCWALMGCNLWFSPFWAHHTLQSQLLNPPATYKERITFPVSQWMCLKRESKHFTTATVVPSAKNTAGGRVEPNTPLLQTCPSKRELNMVKPIKKRCTQNFPPLSRPVLILSLELYDSRSLFLSLNVFYQECYFSKNLCI